MNWLLMIIGGLVGVVGLLYGYLQRVKRGDAEERADTFFKAFLEEERDHKTSVARFEKLIFHLRAELQSLRDELDASLPADKLRDRINVILRWRVPSPAGSDSKAGATDMPTGSASGNGESGGSLGG